MAKMVKFPTFISFVHLYICVFSKAELNDTDEKGIPSHTFLGHMSKQANLTQHESVCANLCEQQTGNLRLVVNSYICLLRVSWLREHEAGMHCLDTTAPDQL